MEGDKPTVTIGAAYAKNRRDNTLPLTSDTAALLTSHLAGKMPHAPAFNMPIANAIVDMFRADLAAARTAWLDSLTLPKDQSDAATSTFLSDRDESGRWADFHALRHSFISGLVNNGVNPKTAKRLARHSTITLTMDRYTHLRRGQHGDGAGFAAGPVSTDPASGPGDRNERPDSLVT